MDVTDTFQEQIVPDLASPSGLSTVYLGQLEPIVALPVAFQVNQLDGVPDNLAPVPPGGPIPPAILIVPRRNHGPIIDLDTALGVGLSIQYTGFSGTRELEAFRAFNPAGTSLDNNPLNQLRPGGGIYYLNPGYAIGTRAGRIKQALGERLAQGPITRADMQAIQADVVMLDAQVLTPYILAAFDNATADGATLSWLQWPRTRAWPRRSAAWQLGTM